MTELEEELTIKVKRLEDDCKAYNFTQHTLQEKIKELEAQIECLNEEIIKALNECLDFEWLHAHNGKAKYLYLRTVIDIVSEKFKETKEK